MKNSKFKMRNCNFFIIFCLFIVFCSLMVIVSGCGQTTSTSTTGNYTVLGKISGVTTGSIKTAGTFLTVTHIVAISANGEKYLADLNSDGTFSIKVNKGLPYAVGFYNQSSGSITLLGYLQQKDVDWDTLPIIMPADETVDLGNVELKTDKVEAIPSLNLTSLISEMNMVDQTTASYYGKIDDALIAFTNLDVNGNGNFDFQENKVYVFAVQVEASGETTGQISKMLNSKYNEEYKPNLTSYLVKMWSSEEPIPAAGTTGSMKFPQSVTFGSTTTDSVSGAVSLPAGGWTFFPSTSPGITSPTQPPSGTYTVEVTGKGTYTFKNVQSSEILKVGSIDGIIYPVFNIVADADGYITRLNYKWKKLSSGTITTPTEAELKAAILDSSSGLVVYTDPTPNIGFLFKESFGASQGMTPIKISRDAGYVDIDTVSIIGGSPKKVKTSDISAVTVDCAYNSSTYVRFYHTE
jgi:hypothetical protein